MNTQTQTLADLEGILLFSALAQPKPSRSRPDKIQYSATVAYPASAGAALAALMTAVSPRGNLNGLRLGVKRNVDQAKPWAGIPDDSLIVHLAAFPDAPPELFTATGEQIPADVLNSTAIRSEFYAGQRVRVNGNPFYWDAAARGGGVGISWNLVGLLSLGTGERRAGGAGGEPSASVFARYGAVHATPPTGVQGGGSGAAAQTATSTSTSTATPGAIAPQGAAAGNPFVQSGNGSPF